jgi:hypothetical protein
MNEANRPSNPLAFARQLAAETRAHGQDPFKSCNSYWLVHLDDEIEQLERIRANYQTVCVEKDREIERLRAALENAVDVIETWHNMGGASGVWDIYYRNAPEMKPIREALTAAETDCKHQWVLNDPKRVCIHCGVSVLEVGS